MKNLILSTFLIFGFVNVEAQIDKERKSDNTKSKIAFQAIDHKPVFPGCEKFEDAAKRNECFNQKVQKLILENFDRSLAKKLNLEGTVRILNQFTINKNGEVSDLQIRARHQELKQEAKRVLRLLPKMQPGEQDGEKVAVTFALPIAFKVEGNNKAEDKGKG